jgi:hypothetical protein
MVVMPEAGEPGLNSPEELLRLIAESVVDLEIDEIDGPHVVACRDVESGHAVYTGPYSSGLAALVAAETDRRLDGRMSSAGAFEYAVIPLVSPAE